MIDKWIYFGYTLFSMSTQVITIKVDPTIKKQAQNAAEELGLSLSAVLKGYLKQFIRTKTITFSASDEKPSQYLIDMVKQAREDLKTGEASPTFKTGEDAVAWLEKQGI